MQTKIGIIGSSGNIGKAVYENIQKSSEFILSYGVNRKNTDFAYMCEVSDILLDFSTPELLPLLLKWSLHYKKPCVIGTTGYSASQFDALHDASYHIPLFYAENFSIGIFALHKALEKVGKILPKEYQVKIIEWHKTAKKDAPSGTALCLAQTIQEQKNHPVGITSMRSGNFLCEHNIFFTGQDERIQIKHEVQNKSLFAKNALLAAKFLLQKPIGYYTMRDLFEDEKLWQS